MKEHVNGLTAITTAAGAEFQYDVCLSFAGKQRPYVERVAKALRSQGVRVFFDDYEAAHLWGKDLFAHLDEVYGHLGRYCVLFASAEYARKVWTNHERRSAQARALKAKREYILPVRFDSTPIPGLPDTVHYIDLRKVRLSRLVRLILEKVGATQRREYFPPEPDRLFTRLNLSSVDSRSHAHSQAVSFFNVLRRMTPEERDAVLSIMLLGCPAELPENLHIHVDLLRRVTGRPPVRLKRILGGLNSLGFNCSLRSQQAHETEKHRLPGNSQEFVLKWTDLSDESDYPALLAAREMVHGATEDYCEEHGRQFLERLDFSQLAKATASKEVHKLPAKVQLQRTKSAKLRRG